MKKFVSLILALLVFLGCSPVFAEDMGVQVIGGPDLPTEPVSLDDIKIGADITIDGYGILKPTNFYFDDALGHYKQGWNNVDFYDAPYYESGQEAEYALLRMDITNISKTNKDYLGQCEVKAVFDDGYEYGGWYYQCNYNNKTDSSNKFGYDASKQNVQWAIDKTDNFAIEPMYQGHYIFGCTLPNAVVNSKAPLCIIITIDGNEITYHVRK